MATYQEYKTVERVFQMATENPLAGNLSPVDFTEERIEDYESGRHIGYHKVLTLHVGSLRFIVGGPVKREPKLSTLKVGDYVVVNTSRAPRNGEYGKVTYLNVGGQIATVDFARPERQNHHVTFRIDELTRVD